MSGDVWSLFGMLAAVIAILFLAYWVTKWIGGYNLRRSGATFGRSGGSFCVIGQLSLGRSGQLLLVRLEERCLLLGVTNERITLLKELDEADSAKWLTGPDSAGAPPGFMDVLRENLRRRK